MGISFAIIALVLITVIGGVCLIVNGLRKPVTPLAKTVLLGSGALCLAIGLSVAWVFMSLISGM